MWSQPLWVLWVGYSNDCPHTERGDEGVRIDPSPFLEDSFSTVNNFDFGFLGRVVGGFSVNLRFVVPSEEAVVKTSGSKCPLTILLFESTGKDH